MLDYFDTAMGFAAVMLLLSLLVTVLVQMVVGILGLRSGNLAWGVKKLLLQIEPALGKEAATITKAVLKHPAVSHMFRKTTAVSASELLMLLEDIGNDPRRHKLDPAKSAAFVALVQKAAPGVSAQQSAQALQVVGEMIKLFPQHVEAVQGAVGRALQARTELESKVTQWFDTVMNRTTERFVAQTRMVTAIFGVALAFALNVDSIYVLRQLAESKELRSTFVAYADATLKQAQEAKKVVEQSVVAATVIRELAGGVKEARRAATLKTVPASIMTREQGMQWLSANLPDDASRAELMLAYSEGYQRASMTRVEELGATAKGLREALDQRLLKIAPPQRSWTLESIVGLVITALFLSLGAPFWFNTLRNLSNLRPVIAARVEGSRGA